MADDDQMGWFWNNRTGGGGAPLKNSNGEVITNLKQAIKNGNIDYNSPKNNNNRPDIRHDNNYNNNNNYSNNSYSLRSPQNGNRNSSYDDDDR